MYLYLIIVNCDGVILANTAQITMYNAVLSITMCM